MKSKDFVKEASKKLILIEKQYVIFQKLHNFLQLKLLWGSTLFNVLSRQSFEKLCSLSVFSNVFSDEKMSNQTKPLNE